MFSFLHVSEVRHGGQGPAGQDRGLLRAAGGEPAHLGGGRDDGHESLMQTRLDTCYVLRIVQKIADAKKAAMDPCLWQVSILQRWG